MADCDGFEAAQVFADVPNQAVACSDHTVTGNGDNNGDHGLIG